MRQPSEAWLTRLLADVRLAPRATQSLAEGAGAASLMAAVKMRDQLVGRKIVFVMSRGNLKMSALQRIIA